MSAQFTLQYPLTYSNTVLITELFHKASQYSFLYTLYQRTCRQVIWFFPISGVHLTSDTHMVLKKVT
eukprot:UN19356